MRQRRLPAGILGDPVRWAVRLAPILRDEVHDVALRDERKPEYRRRVQFRLLGPLQVDAVDGPVSLGGPKQRAVLATSWAARTRSSRPTR